MGDESGEMHSEDDKALLEKNKKRIVKTRAQIEALEKFYHEHKYPSESMKLQIAESIGLTEKQVSGWFCHRRLKDKKVIHDEKYVTGGKHDRTSGVIQDRGSWQRQDSCGSTKQGNDRNLDTREVESERLTPKEFSTADLTYEHGSQYAGNYNRTDDLSSESDSSLREMSNHQNGSPFDAATSRYLVPKFNAAVKNEKPRSGPSGYLKVKGQVENAAIIAVKRQLGKHYREDGPPLGVDFDSLPPGAFESSMQDPVEETYYTGEAVLPASPEVSKMHRTPSFGKERELKRSMALNNPNIDGRSFKTRRGYDIPDNYTHQKLSQHTSLSNGGVYYPRTNSSIELPNGYAAYAKDIPGNESWEEYGMRVNRPRVEVMRTDSFSNNHNLQPYGGKMREERTESWFQKYNDVGSKGSFGENTENEYSNLTMKGNEYHSSGEKGLSRQIIKDGRMMYPDRRMINENRAKVPFKNDLTAPKRMREELPLQQHLKRPSVVDNQSHKYQLMRSRTEMPSSFSEDEESAETSCSVD